MKNTNRCRTFVCQACREVLDVSEGEVERWYAESYDATAGVVWHEECPVHDELRESYFREFTEDVHIQMYVNVYDVHDAYGGPEEGGWWYQAGSAVASIPVPGKITRRTQYGQSVLRTQADEKYEALAMELVVASYGTPEKGGDMKVRVEDHPAEDYPKHRPYYC